MNHSHLVLLHGFCESREIFHHLLPLLPSNFQALTPDLPGFGAEPFQPKITSIDSYADWLAGWMDNLGLEKAVIVGHSFGGYVALAFAEKYPHRIEGLGMLHSTALADTEERKVNRNKSHAFILQNGKEAFLKVFVPSLFHNPKPEWISELAAISRHTDTEAILQVTCFMRDRPDRSRVAHDLEIPLHYLIGAHDSLILPERSRMEVELVRPDKVTCLPDAGHMGMYEDPKGILEWLKGLMQACPVPALTGLQEQSQAK